MTRRSVLGAMTALGVSAAWPTLARGQTMAAPILPRMSADPLRPSVLRQGDRVALVWPASRAAAPDEVERAKKEVSEWGLLPMTGPSAGKTYAYLAGTDVERAADINWAFADPEIRAVLCVRGGWGCARMLPYVDMDLVRANPKLVMGFSDITALLVGLHKATGLITFHGPNAISRDSEFSTKWLNKALFDPAPLGMFDGPDRPDDPNYTMQTVWPGRAKGILMGGNVAVLSALAGTPFAPDFTDTIAFFEDVNEAPYRIDRMLTQLLQACNLHRAKGVAVGQFTRCDDPDSEWKVADVIRDRLGTLGIPVVSGFAIGHVLDKLTVPIGAMAELDGDARTLTVTESATRG